MNVHEEVQDLNLPQDSFVVVGSGLLHTQGIRPSNDIDMIVSENTFDILKKSEAGNSLVKKMERPGS